MTDRTLKNSKAVSTRDNGFTLIEILLVMLITSVLVLGVNTAFKQAHMLWSRVENQRPVYQKSRLLLDTMREEMTGLYLPKGDQQQQLRPFSLSSLPDGTTRLSFYTLNPSWKNTATSSFPAKVGYEFTTDSDSEQKVLLRTEQLCSGEKAIGLKWKEIIFTGLSEFSVRAADPNSDLSSDSWKDNLECNQVPPKAVKILLKWAKDNETEFEVQTIIKVTYQRQITSDE